MKLHGLSALIFSVLSLSSHAGNVYQCLNNDGRVSFQDRPCQGETIKVEESAKSGPIPVEHMIKVLARMTGKGEEALKDPSVRQAAEVLVATDAAKAYAFTKVYGATAEHCPPAVSDQLRIYEDKADDVISLGRYYYETGMYFQMGNNEISYSGPELTAALDQMLQSERDKYKYADKPELDRLCKGALDALRSLTMLYGS